MYRSSTFLIAFLLAICLSMTCYANDDQTAYQPQPSLSGQIVQPMGPAGASQPGAMGAGPGGGMPGDMAGMMGMMSMMHPAIVVDDTAVYVVRGNELIKLRKSDLSVVTIITLPPPQGMAPPQPGARGGGPSSVRPQAQQTMEQMQQMTGPRYEQAFLENMIRHHQGAIEMSKLALTKAQHRELIDFARKTITNQGREQQQFSNWLKTWYSVSATKTPRPIDTDMISRERGLTGKDFEIAFMQDMIMHHSEAVVMSQDAEQKVVHPEVKSAAANIITQQSSEIQQLRNWLSTWYGVNP